MKRSKNNIICKLFGHKLELCNYEFSSEFKEDTDVKLKHNKCFACKRCWYIYSFKEEKIIKK